MAIYIFNQPMDYVSADEFYSASGRNLMIIRTLNVLYFKRAYYFLLIGRIVYVEYVYVSYNRRLWGLYIEFRYSTFSHRSPGRG